MYFRQILHEETSCVSYMVGCPGKGVCAVIDAQGDPEVYITKAQSRHLRITAVMETHIQADHLSSSKELAEKVGARLHFGPKAQVRFPHETLRDGQILEIGNRRITILHTPGHTPEHICFIVDGWFVLTGDTLFVGDVGRVDLALDQTKETSRSRANQLYDSIQRLLTLPDWTEIYPGHYAGSVCGKGMDGKPMSTIGWERRRNRAATLPRPAFTTYLIENVPPVPKDFQTIKQRNAGA